MEAKTKKYNVLLCGVQTGYDIEVVAKKLAESAKLSSFEFKKMLLEKSVILKSDVDRTTAEKIRTIIIRCGADCSIQPVEENIENISLSCDSKGQRKKENTKAVKGSKEQSNKKRKRRSPFFRGVLTFVVFVLVSCGCFFLLRYRTIAEFNANLSEYDRKTISLATPEETRQTLNNLIHLHNQAVENTPFFSWSDFNPAAPPLQGIYSRNNISDITKELSNRKNALIERMEEAAKNESSLYGISIRSVAANLYAFEYCIIRTLVHRNKRNLEIEAAFQSLWKSSGNAVDCASFPVRPLNLDAMSEELHPYDKTQQRSSQFIEKWSVALLQERCKHGNINECNKLSIILAEQLTTPGAQHGEVRQRLAALCSKGVQSACEAVQPQ